MTSPESAARGAAQDIADVPAVADQCIAAQESLRMSSADVPALFALGFASAALAARCRIEMEPGWRPPPHLFVIASVPSGRGKSGAVERMGGVLQRRWQADVGREWDEIALAAAVQRDTARALYSDYQRQAVRLRKVINEGGRKGESLVEASASLEVIEGHLRKAQLEIQAAHLSKPTWIQADSTPEKFVNLVKEFGFALLVAGEGATILQAFTQGSMGRNRVAALLSAWTGEALDRARVGGPNSVVVVDRYAELHACMVLPVQNFLLEPSGEDRERTTILRELAAAGFFARCLVAREEVTGTCEAPVEFDDTWVGVPWVTCARHVAAKNAWEELLSDIWLSGYRPPPAQPLAPERPDEPYSIQLAPEARDYLLRFQRWAAEQTKTGGRWAAERVAESAARVGEQAMRVADQLRKTGKAQHPSLGVSVGPASTTDPTQSGARITKIVPGGAAAEANIPDGAVIHTFGGRTITSADEQAILRTIFEDQFIRTTTLGDQSAWIGASEAMSAADFSQPMSGWRRIVPVDEQGASSSTASKVRASSQAPASAATASRSTLPT